MAVAAGAGNLGPGRKRGIRPAGAQKARAFRPQPDSRPADSVQVPKAPIVAMAGGIPGGQGQVFDLQAAAIHDGPNGGVSGSDYREIIEHKETAMLAQYIREKGRQEGRQETQKENIVEILQMRFGKIPNEIVDRINSIEDPNALKKLLRMAVQLNRMDPDKLFS